VNSAAQPDVAAPVAVVTGATGGIGRWIARGLVRAGATVVLVGRDTARGAAVLDWLQQDAKPGQLHLMLADLSDLAATRALGQAIARRHPRLGVLVNNAGVFRARRAVTAEGHDLVLTVNHLAPFVLMQELEPALRAGAPARLVTVGSSTSDSARLDPANLELHHHWGMVRAYGQSKLATMMTTFEWARRLQGSEVTANVVHPGTVATGLVRSPGVIGLAWRLMAPWVLTEEQGADTPVHVATDPALAAVTGAYFKQRKVVTPNRLALDAALCRQVWDETARLIATGPGAPPRRR